METSLKSKTNITVRKIVLIVLCAILLSACRTTQNTPQDNIVVRWPDFLRDWAADYELNYGTRLDLINIIDTVYQFLEDSTASMDDYCNYICRMKEGINETIVHDEELKFRCMMRATAMNFWSYALKDRRFFECSCSGEVLGSITLWHTITTDSADFMSFISIPVSWQASSYYAELGFIKHDDIEYPMAGVTVVNNEDKVMDKIQIQFCDSTNRITSKFNEDELYVDSTGIIVGLKILFLPYEEVVTAMLNSQQMIVTFFDASGEKREIWGVPHAAFLKQVGDCPRLQAEIKEQKGSDLR